MNETHVTAVGTICTALTPKRVGPEGRLVVNFRVACHERRRDRLSGQWGDGDSFYIQVSCWRRLAENVLASLVTGDPVVVTGRLYTRSWETEGEKRSTVKLDASSVAVDLSRHRAVVVRQSERVVYDATTTEPEPGEPGQEGESWPTDASEDGGSVDADEGGVQTDRPVPQEWVEVGSRPLTGAGTG